MRICEIIIEDELLDEAGTPSLKDVLRELKRQGWTKREGGSHEKWFPPEGFILPDNRPFITIPRSHCNPHTLRDIIKIAKL